MRAPRWVRALLLALLGAGLLAATGLLLYPYSFGLSVRHRNDTVAMPLKPRAGGGWMVEDAWPGLVYDHPVALIQRPGDPDRLFLIEHPGRILLIDASVPRADVFLDIRAKVFFEGESGLVGLAFHPEFGRADSPNRDFFYVYYTARNPGPNTDRLSRFRARPGGRVAEPDSELVLIDQQDEHSQHNAGTLLFGDDGFLYVPNGDEGDKYDEYENSQRIDRDLFGGVLRIDVDRRGGDVSHPPPRQPETGKTAHYYVPNDNPFVGVPGALEEFWALGLRNPYQMSFDEQTGELWAPDVGHRFYEEINVLEAGGNYQWAYMDGYQPHMRRGRRVRERPDPVHGNERPPLLVYRHLDVHCAIIGGLVYRGAEHAELFGKYLFGDLCSGRVWTFHADENGQLRREFMLTLPPGTMPASFVGDARGEIYVVAYSGRILRLSRAAAPSLPPLPATLSETGVFSDTVELTPSPGVIEYAVNVPQWSEAARTRRWIRVPGDGTQDFAMNDRIFFSAEGAWFFPTGTVFVQHFDSEAKRLETRLLVRDDQGGVYGATYRWNEAGTDALLVDDSRTDESCGTCHNAAARFVLGVNTRQLNRGFDYAETGRTRNQLRTWNHIGLFSERPHRIEPTSMLTTWGYPKLASSDDPDASLDERVRSFLDANCSSCHRPGGLRSGVEARSFILTDERDRLEDAMLALPGHTEGALRELSRMVEEREQNGL